MTKLEAVNIMLTSIGEPAVNSLEGAGVDAQMASDILDETIRSVLTRGWYWNHEVHKLLPEVSQEIRLPSNTLKVDSINGSKSTDVVQRGLRLFDRTTNLYTFSDSVEVEIFVVLPFEELVASAKDYITYFAAEIFQSRVLGADSVDKKLVERKQLAWLELLRDELEVMDSNYLYTSWSSRSILDRSNYNRRN